MASLPLLKSYLEKNYSDFEAFFKDFVNEIYVEEDLSDVICTAVKKVINSIRFWTGKMQKVDNNVMLLFTTLTFQPDVKPSFLSIFKSLNNLFDVSNIKQLYIPENRNFIGMEFNSKEDCDFVRKNFKMVDESYIVHTSWVSDSKIYHGRIHWLPMNEDRHKVSEFLNKYFIVKELSNVNVLICENVYKSTNGFEFKALLKPNCELDLIPHMIEINSHKALITIKGRKPLCTNCRKIGHIRRDCEYFYCSVCKYNVLRDHDCGQFKDNMTYAHVTNLSVPNPENKVIEKIHNESKPNPDHLMKGDTEAWLVVNKDRHISYSKVPNNNELEDESVNQDGEVKNSDDDQDNEMQESNEESEETKDSPLSQNPKSRILKRKLDATTLQNKSDAKLLLKKSEDSMIANVNFVDSNPFEILSTDESETY